MLDTGIFLRAKIGNGFETVDIGDPRLDAEQLLRWLASLRDKGVLRTIRTVRKTLYENEREFP